MSEWPIVTKLEPLQKAGSLGERELMQKEGTAKRGKKT
jgi:hypothetical protein